MVSAQLTPSPLPPLSLFRPDHLFCFLLRRRGRNQAGQLGNGTFTDEIAPSTPVDLSAGGANGTAVAVSAGVYHSAS